MLAINSVIQAEIGKDTVFRGISRVVGIHDGYAYLMRLDISPLTAPATIFLQPLLEALENEDIYTVDIFTINVPLSRDQLSKSAQKSLDKALSIMKPILDDQRVLFDKEYRGKIFKGRSIESGASVRNIRRLYYLYLWGGQTELSLVRYHHRKMKKVQKSGTSKRGPRNSNTNDACQLALPDIRDRLEKGVNSFFLKGEYTLMEAYSLTLKRFFSVGTKLQQTSPKSPVEIIEILPPVTQLPTTRQFRYICDQQQHSFGKRQVLPRRMRPKEPIMERRGKVRDNVPGPGFRFEIDSTKIQIQLVSRYDRSKLIGSPTLYLVIDVWSGAIVGHVLSLENSSWSLAAKALRSCFQDKGEIFERLKLPYTSKDWPCHHLPTCITADRAELMSNKAAVLPEIGIKVEILPPMKPQWKPLVERSFSEIKHGDSIPLPGKHPKFRKRRETDGKNSAAMTITELEERIVELIISFNNEPQCYENIPPEILSMSSPNVTKIGIYTWGISNRPGFWRKLSDDDVCTFLLMKGAASIRPNGLYFKGLRYYSQRLVEGGYLSKSGITGHYQVEIRYDERLADHVWFIDSTLNKWVLAETDNEEVFSQKMSFLEFEQHYRHANRLINDTKMRNIYRKDDRNAEFRQNVKVYKKITKIARSGKSKSKSRESIRSNREIERQVDRALESAVITGELIKLRPAANRTPENPTINETELLPPPKLSIARRAQKTWNTLQ